MYVLCMDIIKHLKTSQNDNGTSLLQEFSRVFLRFQNIYTYI